MFHRAHRGADALRAIREHDEFRRRRQTRFQLRHKRTHAVHDFDHVGAGLALDVDQNRRQVIGPSGEATIFRSVFDLRHIAEPQRRAVAPRDDEIAKFFDGAELVVGVHQDRADRAVEAALRLIHARGVDRAAHVGQVQPARRQRAGVDLHADRWALAAGEAHHAHAGNLREFLRDARIHEIMHLRQRQRRRRHREREDRRVGGINFTINGRRREIVGQEIARGVDGRLHFLFRDGQGDFERELERDHRGTAGARRRHLVHAGDLAETTFERRGDRTRHHRRARAGIKRENLDRREIDLRERRDGQQPISHDARQQQRDHEEARRHRPQNKRT